ncbi:MAG: C-GCAxxG-C-C family protein [Clostridium argentinense]|uniref:C-GCAxxG-C-C family protein n=1 Tax=Clostridium faecium TaxID=2762223 RepID=A0ABR8YU15_9CLOT|nr:MULTISPECIES: C-GCAxxG-C-C family (seleno)protein [Clostridium]MBD8047689.1 C-GCAxxG-C-C family protein [Clostridium faecium]MBS5825183.1 C-GCAxxG-C-C family protein [Clostridium argentinense]MDU1348813.1 C-GCAxxG-C-C family (seleno)protein [Clostridium argentinense]
MLIDKVKKFYDSEYDLNCAETIIYAANEEYDMNLNKQTLKAMAAFGGGMAVESVCGVITGAIAVLGILFTEDRAHESDRIKTLTKEYFEKFTSKLGTDNCAQLKEKYRNDEVRCFKMIEIGAEVLDEIVMRERN